MRSRLTALFLATLVCFGLRAAPVLASAGDLDPDFGHFGIAQVKGFKSVGSLAASGDDGFVASGELRGGLPALAKMGTDGALDADFGENGVLQLSSSVSVEGIVSLPSRAIRVLVKDAGGASVLGFDSDGRIDSSWDGDGSVDLPGAGAGDLAVDSSDRVVVSTPTSILRLMPGGGADSSFATDGSYEVAPNETVVGAAAYADGRVIVATDDDLSHFHLTRLQADGSPDPTFGVSGSEEVESMAALEQGGRAHFAFDSTGRLYVARTSCGVFSGCVAAATRLLPDGQVDPQYGSPAVRVPGDSIVARSAGELWSAGDLSDAQPPNGFAQTGQVAALTQTGASSPARTALIYIEREPSQVAALVEVPQGLVAGGSWERGAFLARVLTGGGRHDADADQFADRKDGCPLSPASAHLGCPGLGKRHVQLIRRGHGIVARVGSADRACRADVPVLVHRVGHRRHHVSRMIRRRTSENPPFKVRVRNLRAGRYVAMAKSITPDQRGRCKRATSRKVHIRSTPKQRG